MVEALHTYLIFSTTNNDVDSSCFAIGRSTANQRIEAYWSQLVKDGPGWWINFFKDLRDLHLFNDSDPAHIECIRFCFMHLLRKELYQVAELWNQHIISSSKFGNSSGPRGRPDCMYFLPHLYETENYQVTIAPIELEEFDHATMQQFLQFLSCHCHQSRIVIVAYLYRVYQVHSRKIALKKVRFNNSSTTYVNMSILRSSSIRYTRISLRSHFAVKESCWLF